MRVSRAPDEEAGVLAREQEIKTLALSEFSHLERQLEDCRSRLRGLTASNGMHERISPRAGRRRISPSTIAAHGGAGIRTGRGPRPDMSNPGIAPPPSAPNCGDMETQLAAEQEVLGPGPRSLAAIFPGRGAALSGEREELDPPPGGTFAPGPGARPRRSGRRRGKQAYDLGLKVESLRAQAQSLDEGRDRNLEHLQQLEARIRRASRLPAGQRGAAWRKRRRRWRRSWRRAVSSTSRCARAREKVERRRNPGTGAGAVAGGERAGGRPRSARVWSHCAWKRRRCPSRRKTVEEQFANARLRAGDGSGRA